jgi:hypothetical protein
MRPQDIEKLANSVMGAVAQPTRASAGCGSVSSTQEFSCTQTDYTCGPTASYACGGPAAFTCPGTYDCVLDFTCPDLFSCSGFYSLRD